MTQITCRQWYTQLCWPTVSHALPNGSVLHDVSDTCSLGALCRMYSCTYYLNSSVLHDVSDTCSLGAVCRMHSCTCYVNGSVLHDVSDTCSLGALCRTHSQ